MKRWAIGAALAGFLLHQHIHAASAASAGAAAGMKVGDSLKDNPEYNRSGSARPSCPAGTAVLAPHHSRAGPIYVPAGRRRELQASDGTTLSLASLAGSVQGLGLNTHRRPAASPAQCASSWQSC